jgi:hypothetical protein
MQRMFVIAGGATVAVAAAAARLRTLRELE